MKCNQDCFNCSYEDCILGENDIRNEKRRERYRNGGKEKEQAYRERITPKCNGCRFRRKIVNRDGNDSFICNIESRVITRTVTTGSPHWCPKRMDETLGMTAKEKRMHEMDIRICKNLKERQSKEKQRVRDINRRMKIRECKKNGICPHCFQRKILPGRSKCAVCLERDAVNKRKVAK